MKLRRSELIKLGRRLGLPFPTFLGVLSGGIRFQEKKRKLPEPRLPT